MTTASTLPPRRIAIEERYQLQNQSYAIRNIYDAIIELVTNSDDRYQRLGIAGSIEVEVRRQRRGKPCVLRVRDLADGMTARDMDDKLARTGGRISGLEDGASVRGTNSRGAKDIAALGPVTFESIKDGLYHRCEIRGVQFQPYESQDATPELRQQIGILEGTGTLVTLEISASSSQPQHETLVEKVSSLVALREILLSPGRESREGDHDP